MRTLVTIICLLPAAFWTAASAQEQYVFEVDGEPYDPEIISLRGTPKAPAPGDLAYVGGFWIPLDEPGGLRFDEAQRHRLLLARADGTQHHVAVSVWHGGRKPIDSLAGLDPREVSRLRCLLFDAVTPTVARALRAIDPSRCVVVVHRHAKSPVEESPLPLPPDLAYLMLKESVPPNVVAGGPPPLDLSRQGRLPRLRVLVAEGGDPLPQHLIEGADELRVLHIRRRGLPPLACIAARKSISDLALVAIPDEFDAGFVEGLPELRRLDLRWSLVKGLPESLPPLLRHLRIAGTDIDDGTIDRLRRRYPDLRIYRGKTQVLRDRLSSVDEVRVRPGGVCGCGRSNAAPIFTESEPDRIERLLSGLRIRDDEDSLSHEVKTCGHYTFQFLREGELIGEVGLVAGLEIRWPGVFEGDQTLTEGSREIVSGWLRDHGIPR